MESKEITPKKNKVTKKLQKFIESISKIVDTTGVGLEEAPQSYVSKIDGSYLTFVGLENNLKFLLKHGITENIQNWNNTKGNSANIGFNPIEQKWYGWSHRAIFGFGIGSECKKGNCGYSAGNKIDFAEKNLRWYGDTDMDETYKINSTVKEHTKDGVLGVLVEYEYDNTVPNEAMRGKKSLNFEPYPEKWGKGEWTAQTRDEAKEMAIDFAKGVS
jgi:hypothetical protein